MSSAFSPRLPRNRYTPSFSILVKCHRKTSKKKKMCETHLEVTKPTLHLTPMSFFQMRQIFATSMLRCVLGISGYLRPSGVSGATKFQLVHGIEANDLQQGWMDWGFGDGPKTWDIWYSQMESTHHGPWMETYGRNSTKKTPSPSFIDSNSRNCCARMGKINIFGA